MPRLNIDFSENDDPIAYSGWDIGNSKILPVVADDHDQGSGFTEFIGWLPNEFDPNRVRGHYASFFTHPGADVEHASVLTHGPEYIPNFVYLRAFPQSGGFRDLRLHTAAPNYPELNLPSRVDIEAFPLQGPVEVPPGSGNFVDGVFAQRVRDFRTAHFQAVNDAALKSFTEFDIIGDDSATVRVEKSNPEEPATAITAGQLITSPALFNTFELRVKGGSGDDIIFGHELASNVVIGTPGQDNLNGGSKNDVFDYQSEGLTGATFGLSQAINGRAQEAGGRDSVFLLGSPSEYNFDVLYGGTSTEPSWVDSVITVKRGPMIGPPTQIFTLSDIERVAFQSMTNVVTLTGGKVGTEALELAAEVYGFRTSLEHKAERLAWESQEGQPDFYQTTVTTKAAERGWHRVGALELGIKPADFGEFTHDNGSPLRYSFTNGFYAAKDPRFLVGYDQPEANALVLTGLVNGKKTLAISFRGTDQVVDPMNFLNFTSYYKLFKPLTDGIKDYLQTNPIDQVLVSGHSLGAGAVQYFMNDYAGDTRFRAYTDGSPGSDVFSSQTTDPRIVNFLHTDDPVPFATAATSGPGKVALVAFAGAIAAVGGTVGAAAAAAVTTAAVVGKTKYRVGSDVEMNVPIAGSFSMDEHDKFEYVNSLTRLHKHAADTSADASPFHHTDLAFALRNDQVYTGATIRVAVGRTGEFNNSDLIAPTTKDAFVLGGTGDDDIRFHEIAETRAQPSYGSRRYIDGGEGVDRVVLFNTNNRAVLKAPVAGEPAIDLSIIGLGEVGRLYRIESVITPDADDVKIALLPGVTVPVQTAATGTSTLMVDPKFHHTDVGDGARSVIGSTRGDLIVYGDGAKTIDGFLGDDIILPKEAAIAAAPGAPAAPGPSGATLDPITMDGNDGDDFLRGGDGNDSLNGAHDNDILLGGRGADVLEGGEDVGDMDIASASLAKTQVYIDLLDQAGGAGFMNDGFGWDRYSNIEGAYGGEAADFLNGDSGVNLLRGNGGVDAILGRGGGDTLEGGDGSDLLMGGATYDPAETGTGADRIEGGAGSDLIFAGDGDDIISGDEDADFILAGAGNDEIEGGAGDDFLFGGSAFAFNLADAGDDTFNGGDGVDVMVGGQGVDSLFGGTGNDIIYAGSGNDSIGGWDGDDTLFGDAGADVIAAGAGFDFIHGGAGADVFAFRRSDSYDTVFDFLAAEGDKLRLDPALGVTSFAQFQARVTGFTFESFPYTVLNFASLGFNDQITLKGVSHTAWTSGMVEFA